MADFIQVCAETEVILYGAGQMAHRFCQSLRQEGITIIACLDQDAANKKSVKGIPVLPPDNQVITEYQKQNALVILTQIDVYSHPSIAECLNLAGYQYILYLGALDETRKDRYFVNLNEAYNRLRYEGTILESLVPRYETGHSFLPEAVIRRERNGDVIAFIPLALLFTVERESCFNEKGIPDSIEPFWDRSVLEYLFAFPIFDLFENGLSAHWELDLERYKYFSQYDAHSFGIFNRTRHFEHTLDSRYHIYQRMCQMFYSNREYFCEFPVHVKWNARGYFNIEDGNNRVAFLMCKKQFAIPCRMTECDYIKWLHVEEMQALENICKEFPKFSPSSCFPYPAFFPFKRREKDIILQTICAYLGKSKYSIRDKRVLCLEQTPSYLPHHFYKMGAKVTWVLGEYYDMARSMREVFDTSEMKVFKTEERKKEFVTAADIIVALDDCGCEFLREWGTWPCGAVIFWRKAVELDKKAKDCLPDSIFYAENGIFTIEVLNIK